MNHGNYQGLIDSVGKNISLSEAFFQQLRTTMNKLAEKKNHTNIDCSLNIRFNLLDCKGCDAYDFVLYNDRRPILTINDSSLYEIINDLKLYEEELGVLPDPPKPKIASREDRYNAVMKFDERIKRTGSSELEKK